MNYEEKIEYAEPVVIEKRLMQQLIDPSADVLCTRSESRTEQSGYAGLGSGNKVRSISQ